MPVHLLAISAFPKEPWVWFEVLRHFQWEVVYKTRHLQLLLAAHKYRSCQRHFPLRDTLPLQVHCFMLVRILDQRLESLGLSSEFGTGIVAIKCLKIYQTRVKTEHTLVQLQ